MLNDLASNSFERNLNGFLEQLGMFAKISEIEGNKIIKLYKSGLDDLSKSFVIEIKYKATDKEDEKFLDTIKMISTLNRESRNPLNSLSCDDLRAFIGKVFSKEIPEKLEKLEELRKVITITSLMYEIVKPLFAPDRGVRTTPLDNLLNFLKKLGYEKQFSNYRKDDYSLQLSKTVKNSDGTEKKEIFKTKQYLAKYFSKIIYLANDPKKPHLEINEIEQRLKEFSAENMFKFMNKFGSRVGNLLSDKKKLEDLSKSDYEEIAKNVISEIEAFEKETSAKVGNSAMASAADVGGGASVGAAGGGSGGGAYGGAVGGGVGYYRGVGAGGSGGVAGVGGGGGGAYGGAVGGGVGYYRGVGAGGSGGVAGVGGGGGGNYADMRIGSTNGALDPYLALEADLGKTAPEGRRRERRRRKPVEVPSEGAAEGDKAAADLFTSLEELSKKAALDFALEADPGKTAPGRGRRRKPVEVPPEGAEEGDEAAVDLFTSLEELSKKAALDSALEADPGKTAPGRGGRRRRKPVEVPPEGAAEGDEAALDSTLAPRKKRRGRKGGEAAADGYFDGEGFGGDVDRDTSAARLGALDSLPSGPPDSSSLSPIDAISGLLALQKPYSFAGYTKEGLGASPSSRTSLLDGTSALLSAALDSTLAPRKKRRGRKGGEAAADGCFDGEGFGGDVDRDTSAARLGALDSLPSGPPDSSSLSPIDAISGLLALQKPYSFAGYTKEGLGASPSSRPSLLNGTSALLSLKRGVYEKRPLNKREEESEIDSDESGVKRASEAGRS